MEPSRSSGDALNPAPKVKWYFKKRTFIAALLAVGPFALPLLWINPHYSLTSKIIWTVVVLGLTYALGIATQHALEYMMNLYQQMGAPNI